MAAETITLDRWQQVERFSGAYQAVTSRVRHNGQGIITINALEPTAFECLDGLLLWISTQRLASPSIRRQRNDFVLTWGVRVPTEVQIIDATSQAPKLSQPLQVEEAHDSADPSAQAITIRHQTTDRHFKITYPEGTAVDWQTLANLLREEAAATSVGDPASQRVIWCSFLNDHRSTADLLDAIAAVVERAVLR